MQELELADLIDLASHGRILPILGHHMHFLCNRQFYIEGNVVDCSIMPCMHVCKWALQPMTVLQKSRSLLRHNHLCLAVHHAYVLRLVTVLICALQ